VFAEMVVCENLRMAPVDIRVIRRNDC